MKDVCMCVRTRVHTSSPAYHVTAGPQGDIQEPFCSEPCSLLLVSAPCSIDDVKKHFGEKFNFQSEESHLF